MLSSLLYNSSAAIGFSEDQLVALLKQSRENNHKLEVTGLLLYKRGDFLQILEGEEAVVQQLFAAISRDPRHHDVCELRWETSRERRFPNWSMGFKNLDNNNVISQTPGYSEFMNEPLTSPSYTTDPSRVQRLLHVFRQDP